MSTAITSYLLKLSFRPTITMTLAGVDKDFDVKELCYVYLSVGIIQNDYEKGKQKLQSQEKVELIVLAAADQAGLRGGVCKPSYWVAGL